MVRNNRGFTLIEVIVVAAIIAILAGILVPMIFNQIDESKKTKATGDAKSISTAVLAYRKDLGRWPIPHETAGDPFVDVLVSDGTVPTLPGAWTTKGNNQRNFKNHLASDALNYDIYKAGGMYEKLWKGPYGAAYSADPWGNAYVMNGSSLFYPGTEQEAVWVLSAGPDGIVQTDLTNTDLQGDDIGARIR